MRARALLSRPMPEFSQLMDELAADPTVGSGKMFGHDGACLGRKFFAMDYNGDLVLKLGADRVQELIDSGKGAAFEPMPGRAMGGWAQVPPGEGEDSLAEWVTLAEEAKGFLAASLGD
jgi:hypothetical protein